MLLITLDSSSRHCFELTHFEGEVVIVSLYSLFKEIAVNPELKQPSVDPICTYLKKSKIRDKKG